MVGDIKDLGNGFIEVTTEEELVNRPMMESKEERRSRIKQGLPEPWVSYTVVKTEIYKKGGAMMPMRGD